MSISSTQIALRYVDFTRSPDNCAACAHSQKTEAHRGFPQGLRCSKGGFFVVRKAACREFDRAKVQIGPTDI